MKVEPIDIAVAPTADLVLGPNRALALVWTVVGLGAVGLAGWVVRDSGGAPLAWVLLVAVALLTVVVAVPLVAPGLVTLMLDHDGVRGRIYGRPFAARWEDVAVARITEVAGEPFLQLHERDRDARPLRSGEHPTTARGVLLPLGADLDALDAFLARRLGRRSVRP